MSVNVSFCQDLSVILAEKKLCPIGGNQKGGTNQVRRVAICCYLLLFVAVFGGVPRRGSGIRWKLQNPTSNDQLKFNLQRSNIQPGVLES
jgi:hypothetical protein